MKYVIINDVDRPCERLICERQPDGSYRYIHPDHKHHPPMWAGTTATPLKFFGVQLIVIGEEGFPREFFGLVIRESTATYSDGRIRRWQGEQGFHFTSPPVTRDCGTCRHRTGDWTKGPCCSCTQAPREDRYEPRT